MYIYIVQLNGKNVNILCQKFQRFFAKFSLRYLVILPRKADLMTRAAGRDRVPSLLLTAPRTDCTVCSGGAPTGPQGRSDGAAVGLASRAGAPPRTKPGYVRGSILYSSDSLSSVLTSPAICAILSWTSLMRHREAESRHKIFRYLPVDALGGFYF